MIHLITVTMIPGLGRSEVVIIYPYIYICIYIYIIPHPVTTSETTSDAPEKSASASRTSKESTWPGDEGGRPVNQSQGLGDATTPQYTIYLYIHIYIDRYIIIIQMNINTIINMIIKSIQQNRILNFLHFVNGRSVARSSTTPLGMGHRSSQVIKKVRWLEHPPANPLK